MTRNEWGARRPRQYRRRPPAASPVVECAAVATAVHVATRRGPHAGHSTELCESRNTLLTLESQWSDFKLEADGRPVVDGVSSNGQEVADENDAGQRHHFGRVRHPQEAAPMLAHGGPSATTRGVAQASGACAMCGTVAHCATRWRSATCAAARHKRWQPATRRYVGRRREGALAVMVCDWPCVETWRESCCRKPWTSLVRFLMDTLFASQTAMSPVSSGQGQRGWVAGMVAAAEVAWNCSEAWELGRV